MSSLKFVTFILCMVLFFQSCTKKEVTKEPKYESIEFFKLLEHTHAPSDKSELKINFQEYSPLVNRLNSKALSYERLTFNVLELPTQTDAIAEAKRLNQYYSRNWLLDRVEGEPVLEDFLITTLGAKNPNRTIQRIPKASNGHGAAHGTGHGEAPAHH